MLGSFIGHGTAVVRRVETGACGRKTHSGLQRRSTNENREFGGTAAPQSSARMKKSAASVKFRMDAHRATLNALDTDSDCSFSGWTYVW